jgi:soluble P-type ATPase
VSISEIRAGGKAPGQLAVARAAHRGAAWPETQDGFDFHLLGLVGLADPLRPGVVEAVAECRTAGIRVVMITGDYPATAAAIARQAGLDAESIVTGEALAGMDDTMLAEQARNTTVFARIMPEQKLRIVAALKADGEIVAMTGDGVNDAPSLKAAHIGIAMGGRGTDVAREASSLVLLDDDFGSIVAAVRLGRRVFDNLRKSTGFIIAIHVPIAGLALLLGVGSQHRKRPQDVGGFVGLEREHPVHHLTGGAAGRGRGTGDQGSQTARLGIALAVVVGQAVTQRPRHDVGVTAMLRIGLFRILAHIHNRRPALAHGLEHPDDIVGMRLNAEREVELTAPALRARHDEHVRKAGHHQPKVGPRPAGPFFAHRMAVAACHIERHQCA